ncbi:hypothetical protein KKF73_04910, partial [Patescibacteria group bacterium]|nr:hypothetical protein [Patescibacteria group bacterium]
MNIEFTKEEEVKSKDLTSFLSLLSKTERIKGVGQAMAMGGLIREVLVEVDADKLASHGISLAEIAQKLRLENMNKTC